MSIFHAKVSGNANTSPDDVGGEDWDHPHLYGPGSIFMIGMARIDSYPGTGVSAGSAQCFGAILSVEYDSEDYKIKFNLPYTAEDWPPVVLGDLPVVAGSTVNYFIDFYYQCAEFCPESLEYFGHDQYGAMWYKICPLDGAAAPFSKRLVLTARLYASVS